MPTTVDIPSVGVVEFPDGMSQEDITRESEKIYLNSPTRPGRPAPKYEGLLQGPPGFEQPARSSEQLAALNTEARKKVGLPPEGDIPEATMGAALEPLVTPVVKLTRMTPKTVQDAWDFIVSAPLGTEAGPPIEADMETIGTPSVEPTRTARIASGLINAAETVPHSGYARIG